jgi:hypothetical protein
VRQSNESISNYILQTTIFQYRNSIMTTVVLQCGKTRKFLDTPNIKEVEIYHSFLVLSR